MDYFSALCSTIFSAFWIQTHVLAKSKNIGYILKQPLYCASIMNYNFWWYHPKYPIQESFLGGWKKNFQRTLIKVGSENCTNPWLVPRPGWSTCLEELIYFVEIFGHHSRSLFHLLYYITFSIRNQTCP